MFTRINIEKYVKTEYPREEIAAEDYTGLGTNHFKSTYSLKMRQ